MESVIVEMSVIVRYDAINQYHKITSFRPSCTLHRTYTNTPPHTPHPLDLVTTPQPLVSSKTLLLSPTSVTVDCFHIFDTHKMNPPGNSFETSGGDTPNYMSVIPQLNIPTNLPTTPRKAEPDYLDYDMRGRGFMERAFANTGLTYLLGVTLGSLRGLATQRSLPNATMKIRMNTFLNTIGKHGSRAGNAVGAMAFMYTAFESAYDQADIGAVVGDYEVIPPMLAATATGAVYASGKGPRAAGLAGAIGGGIVLGTWGITKTVGPVFGLGFQQGNLMFI